MDPLGISCLSPDGTTGSSSTNQDTGNLNIMEIVYFIDLHF